MPDKVKETVNKLDINEKSALVQGTDFMFTNSVERLGIPKVRMSDGPHGLRLQKEGGDNGVSGSEPATAFPAGCCTASGWNSENLYKMGKAIGEECAYYGVNVLLGPAVNVKRNPLCGRNFEYFSEDPLLAGELASAQIDGVQSEGVGVALKHFALNNSENYRFMGDSICDMRAMREIYLKPFEIAVKKSKPATVMCAYNKINGVYCSENKWLLTELLRDEWGFDGLVMTDWGATHDRTEGLKAGLDLEMPGDTPYCRKTVAKGVKEGVISKEVIDTACGNVVSLAYKTQLKKRAEADFSSHDRLCAEIAEDCAVLLKNDGILPLSGDKKLCILGELFAKPRYQGSGSSMITPFKLTSPENAFNSAGADFEYSAGYRENTVEVDETLISEAVALAKKYGEALVFAGQTDLTESEGADREGMKLPANQLALIDSLLKENIKIAVVLFGGSPVELPFADSVSAILNMYLAGQNVGTAVYNLLYGISTPCGKLAETWAEKYEDIPFGEQFGKTVNEVYKESVFVGYRYFCTAGKKVRYPFGFGLSYTSFEYSDMEIFERGGSYTISCTVKNTGKMKGAEIVQLYVRPPAGVFRPERELKGFDKIYLGAGESGRVNISVPKSSLGLWDVKKGGFVTVGGEYGFLLCSDCETVKLAKTVEISGEAFINPYPDRVNEVYKNLSFEEVTDELFREMSGLTVPPLPPDKPVTLETQFRLLQGTFFGKIIYRAVTCMAEKQLKKAKKLPDGIEKDNMIKGAVFLKRILDSNCLIGMSMSAGKRMPYNLAVGIMHLCNGRIFKALKAIIFK